MRNLHLLLSDPQYDAMQTMAKVRGLSLSALVRRAIDDYLRYMALRCPATSDIKPQESDHV
jgi:hypothetical protein